MKELGAGLVGYFYDDLCFVHAFLYVCMYVNMYTCFCVCVHVRVYRPGDNLGYCFSDSPLTGLKLLS